MPEGIEVATGYVTVVPSAQGFLGKLNSQIGPQLDATGQQSGKQMGRGMTAGLGAMAKSIFAPLAVAFAGAGIATFFKDAVNNASDLSESTNKMQQVFQGATPAVTEFAAKGATALGMTELQARNAAATFGIFGKSAGLAGAPLSGFSTEMAQLAVDMASFHNTSPEEAIEALGSGLRGEAEPLRKYGVLLDDATLRAEAMKMGLIKTTKEALTPQQKVLAAHAVIMKQTSDAQGDFARTSEGFANQQRIASAQWEDLKGKIGQAFLPALTGAMLFVTGTAMPGLTGFIDKLSALGQGWEMFMGSGETDGLAAALGISEDSMVFQVITDVTTAISDLMAGLSMDSDDRNGFGAQLEGWVLIGAQVAEMFDQLKLGAEEFINGFTGAFTDIDPNNTPFVLAMFALGSWFREVLIPGVMGIGEAFGDLLAVVAPIAQQIFEAIAVKWAELAPTVMAIFATIGQAISDAMAIIQIVITMVTGALQVIWANTGQAIIGVVTGLHAALVQIFQGIANVIGGVVKTFLSILKGDWVGAADGIKQITRGLSDVLNGIFNGIKVAISGAMDIAWGLIRSAFQLGWSWVRDTFGGWWKGVTALFKGPIDSARTTVEGILKKITDAFDGMKGAIGRTMEGVKSAVQGPLDWLSNNVVKPFQDALSRIKLPEFPQLPGFAGGGYTGPGARNKPAGIVHAGEVVWSQDDIDRAGGVGAVEFARRTGLLGYEDGGVVGYTYTPQRYGLVESSSTGASIVNHVEVTVAAREFKEFQTVADFMERIDAEANLGYSEVNV